MSRPVLTRSLVEQDCSRRAVSHVELPERGQVEAEEAIPSADGAQLDPLRLYFPRGSYTLLDDASSPPISTSSRSSILSSLSPSTCTPDSIIDVPAKDDKQMSDNASDRLRSVPPWRSGGGGSSGRHSRQLSTTMSTKRTALGLARRTLGIFLTLVVIIMWTVSNFLTSSIFADDTYSKPYLMSWANSAIFSFLLLAPAFRKGMRWIVEHAGPVFGVNWVFRGMSSRARSGGALYSSIPTTAAAVHFKPGDDDDGYDDDEDDNDATSQARHSFRPTATQALSIDDDAVPGLLPKTTLATDKLTLRQVALLGLEFCPLWFISALFINACLTYTTVASSTVLGATASAFTLGFGALLGVEPFTMRKLMAVAVCLGGVVIISQVDLSGASDSHRGSFPEKTAGEMAIGDALAVLSSLGYGYYTVALKKRVVDESRIDVLMYFGFMGLSTLLLLWPVLLIAHWTGLETFELPPNGQVWTILAVNGVCSLLSDVCWTFAVLLTSPLMITVGLSLSIPLSLLGQMVLNGQTSSGLYWIGSIVVLASFLIANYETKQDAEENDRQLQQEAGAQGAAFALVPQHDRGDGRDGGDAA